MATAKYLYTKRQFPWFTSTDIYWLMKRSCVTERKFLLFGVVLCRRVWDNLSDVAKAVVETSERMADGVEIEKAVLEKLYRNLNEIVFEDRSSSYYAYANASCLYLSRRYSEARHAVELAYPTLCNGISSSISRSANWNRSNEIAIHANIVRQMYKPYANKPKYISNNSKGLALSLYDGVDVAGPLSDSLTEDGAPEEFVNFFREEKPFKGCWELDVLLGRS